MNWQTDAEKEALGLDVRKRIFAAVERFAGSHFRELQRRTGLPTGSIQHHLNFLVRHNVISEAKQGNSVRYFPISFSADNKHALSILRQKSMRAILICLLIKQPRTHDELVQFTGLAPSTISWHLKKLEEKNIITVAKKERKTVLSLNANKDVLMNLLIRHKESFLDALVDNVVDMWEV